MIRRKFIWLMLLMVWVGMVSSIIVYQGDNFITSPATSQKVNIVEEGGSTSSNRGSANDVNLTESKNDSNSNVDLDDSDFFIDYRLERDKARSEQINLYREMINNPNTDEATKKEAQKKMLNLTEKMEKEMEIESLIRARGFKDALAYIHDGSVDVIIQTTGLQKEDVTRVGDIVVKTTGLDFEDVTIIEKKLKNN